MEILIKKRPITRVSELVCTNPVIIDFASAFLLACTIWILVFA
ncbi:hypothetical protein ACIP97_09055 [Peribacillus frigoritolerans]